MNPINVPADALIVLIGASGSGKSTFASRHFEAEAVASSDRLRGVLAGDEADQRVTEEAFRRLHQWLDARLAAGQLGVVDATNVEWMARAELLEVARRHRRPAIAIVLALPLEVCLTRNKGRARQVPVPVIRQQMDDLAHGIDRLGLEGFAAVHVLRSEADVDAARPEIEKGPANRALL
jgi:protein phosphatase